MRPNIRRARNSARALRIRHGARDLPIDVFAIAEAEGIKVEKADLGADVSALLVRDGDRVLIGVNARHVLTRQRFSVAHELAHYALHGGQRELFVDKEYLVKFRDSSSTTGAEPEEVEANQFAAELLMPSELIGEALNDVPLDIDDEQALRVLAARFGVSTTAMTVRLSALGVRLES